ncbi:zinc finger and BTB domain-containing protein 32 [Synchiropus splendidus]|uniref:zinc finger and BTB domain-containing protein 32 n=1 Tax=Synchiropus splendidus TaxID=270530 RepID=UPI00237D38C0|nr:zinc finger and BTB domain-containing protein 32 [Synchiropus splendidus]
MIRISNTDYCHFLGQANLLRQAGSMCDAIISVKGQKFQAHRLVLACASRALAQQLLRSDSDPSLCTVDYVSSHTFQQVLDFTYSQAVEVSMGDLRLLLRAAHHLEMPQLLEQCRRNLDSLHRTEEDQRKFSSNAIEAGGDDHKEKQDRGNSLKANKKNAGDAFPATSPVRNPELSQGAIPPLSNPPYVPPSWTFSPSMWSSVSTLRQIAQSYSSLVTGCPQPTFSMAPVVYPVPFSSPHLLPLLSSCFRSPAQQTLHTPDPHGATAMGRTLGQCLLTREKPSRRALTGAHQNNELREEAQPSRRVNKCPRCRAVSPSSGGTFPGGGLALCSFCLKAERQSKGLKSQHGEKPHRCQHCPKRFSLKHQLDTHHRIHTGEKPFECRLCGQRSRDYSAMIKHLRTHGGASPYQCTVCSEFCSSLVAMQRHIKSHSAHDFPPDWHINSTYLYKSHN